MEYVPGRIGSGFAVCQCMKAVAIKTQSVSNLTAMVRGAVDAFLVVFLVRGSLNVTGDEVRQ